MPVSFLKLASEIFRAFIVDGNPGSGAHKPVKADIRAWGATLEAAAHDPSAGLHMIYLPGEGFNPRGTGGPAAYNVQQVTNPVMVAGKAYDATTAEGAQYKVSMPPSWDSSTPIYCEAEWGATGGSGGVAWQFRALCLGDNEAFDTAFGTAITVTDTLQNANRLHKAARSAGITPAGASADDTLILEVLRDPTNVADTIAQDVILIGVRLFFTTNAEHDT